MYQLVLLIGLPLSCLPVFFYLTDGYYHKNMKKAVMMIAMFFALAFSFLILIRFFGIYFVLLFPVQLFFFLVFSQIENKKMK